jgi:hypothetical protein
MNSCLSVWIRSCIVANCDASNTKYSLWFSSTSCNAVSSDRPINLTCFGNTERQPPCTTSLSVAYLQEYVSSPLQSRTRIGTPLQCVDCIVAFDFRTNRPSPRSTYSLDRYQLQNRNTCHTPYSMDGCERETPKERERERERDILFGNTSSLIERNRCPVVSCSCIDMAHLSLNIGLQFTYALVITLEFGL